MTKYREVISRMRRVETLRSLRYYEMAKRVNVYHGQMPILDFVINNDGCTQKQIADALVVTPASIATSTKRMQNRGLITKKVDEENLRNNTVSATEKGKELFGYWENESEKFNETIFDGFSDDELNLLGEFFDRMTLNLGGCLDESTLSRKEMMMLRKRIKKLENSTKNEK